MNVRERLMCECPNLNYQFIKMPDKLGGLTDGENVWINADRSAFQQTEYLAEEIAHFKTSSGNILRLDSLESRKQELKAREIAAFSLISIDGLIQAYEDGIITPSELSDRFEVSIEFIYKVLDVYRSKYGILFEKHGYLIDLYNGINISKK